jgi:hypothetical protein
VAGSLREQASLTQANHLPGMEPILNKSPI